MSTNDVNRYAKTEVFCEGFSQARAMLNRRLTSEVYPVRIPLPPAEGGTGWEPYPIFNGFTAGIQNLSCHMSVLNKDCRPHPPHSHKEEEILLLLRGEVDLILTDEKSADKTRRMTLKSGQFVYYPAQFAHTLQTVSEQPANYMMFKWQNDTKEMGSPLKFNLFSLFGPEKESDANEGLQQHLMFQGSTDYLRKLHCHTTTLLPGAGYDPHSDTYDVAILVLDGEVETIGKHAEPYSVIFYPAGEPHGMYNPGEAVAKYVVFEFHCRHKGLTVIRLKSFLSLLAKAKDPQRWKKLLKKLLSSHKK